MSFGAQRFSIFNNQNLGYNFKLGHVERVFGSAEEASSPSYVTDSKKFVGITGISSMAQVVEYTELNNSTSLQPKFLAQPLMRGFNDSITRGDLILFITINKKNFYIGPVNTFNDPSLANNHLYNHESNTIERGGLEVNVDKDSPFGYNDNYFPSNVPKLSKPKNQVLDFPLGKMKTGNLESKGPAYYESNFTDMVIEGRHANSIRIGSRAVNPLIIISNKRSGDVESLTDGSIIGMTSFGSLSDNYYETPGNPFKLSCDVIEEDPDQTNPRGVYINQGNDQLAEDQTPENAFNYSFGQVRGADQEEFDQIIISSDRIIFNSNVEDVTLSSKRNINFGANGNFTISNKGFSVIESKNIYIGNEAKQRAQPMVLGNELNKLLVEMLDLISSLKFIPPPGGGPTPVFVNGPGDLALKIKNLKGKFFMDKKYDPFIDEDDGVPIGDSSNNGANYLSSHHFIEPNRE